MASTKLRGNPETREKSGANEEFLAGTLSTLARGLRVLEYVVKSNRLVRLRDVAEEFQLDRSAALRFLRTLEAEGFISRNESFKVYSIGPKLLALPRLAPVVEQMIEQVRPALIDLAQSSGQWSHLAILHGTQAVLVEVVKSPAKVAVKQAVGDLEPLYSSAVGKAIYAHLPERERREMGNKMKFERHTERTLRSLVALDKEAKAIRDSGVAFDRGEGNEQVTCIACPILDQHGYPRASIGISLVAAHLKGTVDQQYEAIARVVEAARDIEKALFKSDSAR